MTEPEKDPKFRAVIRTLAGLWRKGARGRFTVDIDGKGSVWICFEPARVPVTGEEVPALMVLSDK